MNWEQLKGEIKAGSIINCTVKYKNTRFEEVILDYYGFEGVLKLNDVSINIPLAKELFGIIRKGDSFDAVVIDFDDEKNRILLSTKIFRNALDDVLPFSHCVNVIKGNFKRRHSLPNNFLLEQRNTLDRLRGDLSSNELTFLYELIQNAVDHPNRNFNSVSITFEVFNNYLLVKHNGALFTENNFESITGILYGEQIQEGGRNRIGYKGIGFKSVFRFTDNAYIRSGNFSFRFSKIESGSNKPWEVLPLFQLEKDMVEKIPQFDFFNAPVAFAFEFNSDKNKNDVIKYLNQLSQNPYLLIFLDNLTQLVIKAPSTSYTSNGTQNSFSPLQVKFVKEINAENGFDNIKLFINNETHSEWLIHTNKDIEITDAEVISELLNESETAVPAKMRNFRTPSITIALPKQPLKDDVINLFTYLPLSNTKFKLPFLVNADFIPDLDRTDIIHNLKYNNEVLRLVAQTVNEFSTTLIENNQLQYLNELIPDLNIEYQSSSNIIVKSLLKFLPSRTIEYNNQRVALSKIIIDTTGFVSSFGHEIFSELIDYDNVPVNFLAPYKKIVRLIERINPDSIFDFSKLRDKIRATEFISWLKSPVNNLSFIKYLNAEKHLDVFKDETIFLTESGDLCKGHDLFSNFGSDSQLLSWLSYKRLLHQSVLSGLSETSLPLKQYDPITFINEVICKEQKESIVERLKNGAISFDAFYTYLAKYADDPLFPANEIQTFPLQTSQGVIANWRMPIYFSTAPLDLLLTGKSLPFGLFYTLNNNWSHQDTGLQVLAGKLGAKSYKESEPYSFISSIITLNKEQIINYYRTIEKTNIESNAIFWSFVINTFENLSEKQITELKTIFRLFPILSKNGEYKPLHNLYLSSTYTESGDLEKLSHQFPNAGIDFISADYLKQLGGDKSKLKKYFKLLDSKEETSDFLLHTLIPNLHQIEENSFVSLTRLIYDKRESEPVIQAVINSPHFKLKTKEGVFKPINQCYLGSPYIDELQIPNSLNFVPVANQIAEDYAVSHVDAWQRFFSEKLRVSELRNEGEMLSLKLKHINDNLESWKDKQKSILLFSELYSLFKSGNLILNRTNLNYIKNIPILCKGNESFFSIPSSIHFSSAFKPTFDFEKIFGLECGIQFLSDDYKFEDDEKLISFFEQIGISQYFDRDRLNSLVQNVPTYDGQKKPASQLYKYKFKKHVGQSNIAFKDLSEIKYNGRSLEDYFGFKDKLDVGLLLNYINTNQPDKRELKELISELLQVYRPSNDRYYINSFISKGKLLTTAKTYNDVSSLFTIEESIRSGIRENEFLIDPLFNEKKEHDKREGYLKLFSIKTLGFNDFNPHFEGEHIDNEFTKRVNERFVFLAFDSDGEKYLETEKEYKEKFQEWKVKRCSKISLKYPKIDSKIVKEDNKTFEVISDKVFYYIGSWYDPRVNPVLVDCISRNILAISKQRSFIQDLLLNDPKDIIIDFESKGKVVPDEIKQRFFIEKPIPSGAKHDTVDTKDISISEKQHVDTNDESNIEIEREHQMPITAITDIIPNATEEDEIYIKSIIGISYDKDGQIDANTTAKIKTLMAIKNQYISTDISDEGRFLKAGDDQILVRSAQNGLLYLDLFHWERLRETNVRLSVYTKNKVEIYNSQEQLIQYTKPQNKFGIVRMPNEYDVEDYNSLDNISDKGKWHFVFIVNEDAKAAKQYKAIVDLDEYNNYG